eukprot:Gb_18184 [translate_table: standard]
MPRGLYGQGDNSDLNAPTTVSLPRVRRVGFTVYPQRRSRPPPGRRPWVMTHSSHNESTLKLTHSLGQLSECKGLKEEHLTGKGSRQHQKIDLRSSIHLLVLRRIRSAHGWPPSGFRRNGKSPPCGASPSLMEQAVGEQLGSIQQGFLDSIIVLVLIPELLDP